MAPAVIGFKPEREGSPLYEAGLSAHASSTCRRTSFLHDLSSRWERRMSHHIPTLQIIDVQPAPEDDPWGPRNNRGAEDAISEYVTPLLGISTGIVHDAIPRRLS